MNTTTTTETLAALSPTLAAFVRAYLVTALWSSRDATYFHRKAAEAANSRKEDYP